MNALQLCERHKHLECLPQTLTLPLNKYIYICLYIFISYLLTGGSIEISVFELSEKSKKLY